MLAAKLSPKYRHENCAVMALNDGGVVVGAQIAAELHCVLTLLMSTEIKLPQEPQAVAGITAGGSFAYNNSYSEGEMSELVGEFGSYIEQEKLQQMHELNRLVGSGGTINKTLLRGHNIIVVADGVASGFMIDLAYEFLKPIAIKKLVFAVPLASVPAVDRLHVLADDLCCLDVVKDYTDTDHYYDNQDIPDHDTVLKTIERIIVNWK